MPQSGRRPRPGAAGRRRVADRCPRRPITIQDPESVADLFPGTEHGSYLDNASVGLLSTRVHAAVSQVLAAHLQRGSACVDGWLERAEAVRGSVARLVGGQVDGVAFTQNTSTGLAAVTNGLDWRPGDNVVVPAGEFPSNRYPWMHLRRRGVEVRQAAMTDGRARTDEIAQLIDGRTRVLAVSAVQYTSGHRYDLDGLAGVCRRSDALLVVDGTQAVGAVGVDVGRLGIDVLAVSAHKWMLAPFGIGFVHLSGRAMDRLVPSTVGWRSVADPLAFQEEPLLAPDARRFESGTSNAAGIAGLGAAVDLVHELGADWVERRVLDRADELASLLAAAGLRVHHRDDRDRGSGIVIASSSALAAPDLHARLVAGGVACSARGNGIRFAPHYFTGRHHLAHAAEIAAGARR